MASPTPPQTPTKDTLQEAEGGLLSFLRSIGVISASTSAVASNTQRLAGDLATSGAATQSMGGNLLEFIRATSLARTSTAHLQEGLETAAKAIKTVDDALGSLTNLLKLPVLNVLADLKTGFEGLITGALGSVAAFGKSAIAIGSGSTAILAAGAALVYATGSVIPGIGALGLAIEDMGHKVGGFAGEVVFATGAVVTATAAFAAAGAAWRRAVEQVLGPPLTALAAAATAVGIAIGPLGPLLTSHVLPALESLGIGALAPLAAVAFAATAVLGPLADVIMPRVWSAFEAVGAALGRAAESAGRLATGAISRLGDLLQPVWDGIKAGYATAKPYLEAGANYLKESLGKVGTAMAATGGAIAAGIRAGLAIDEIKNSIYKAIQGTIGAVAGALRGFSEQAADLMRAPLQVLDTAVSAVTSNIARFVQLSNPGVFLQFQAAVNDLYASIGHALAPVLQTATNVFRSIGSALYGLNSNGTRLIQALAGGTAALISFAAAVALVETVATGGLAPLLELVGGALAAGIAGAVTASGALDGIMQSFSATLGGVMNAVGAAVVAVEPLGRMLLSVFADIGGMIAGYVSSIAGMISGTGIFGELAEVGKGFYDAFRPIIEALLQVQATITGAEVGFLKHAVEVAGPSLILFARVIGEVAVTVMGWVKSLLSLFVDVPDLAAPKGTLRDNRGAAAGSTSTTDVMSVLQKARENAFSGGAAKGGEDYLKGVASNTGDLVKKAEELRVALTELPNKIAEAIGRGAIQAKDTVRDTLASSPTAAVLSPAATLGAVIDQHLGISDAIVKGLGFGGG